MTIDPEAVLAVRIGIKQYNLRGDFEKLRLSPSVDESREAEAAIHAYREYLKSIGAKVLVPMRAKELEEGDEFHDEIEVNKSYVVDRKRAGGLFTTNGYYGLEATVFVELPPAEKP